MTPEPHAPVEPPLPGFGRTLAAAGSAALVVSLLVGAVIVTQFRDETLEMLVTTALFGTIFGFPVALLVAVIGPHLVKRVRAPSGKIALWLVAGFIGGASIIALPSVLLGKPVDIEVLALFGGLGVSGSVVLMAMLHRG